MGFICCKNVRITIYHTFPNVHHQSQIAIRSIFFSREGIVSDFALQFLVQDKNTIHITWGLLETFVGCDYHIKSIALSFE